MADKANKAKAPAKPAPSAAPAPAAPAAPAPDTAKAKAKTILTFAAITAMDAAAQIGLYRDTVVKPFGSLAKAKDTIVESLHNAMKVVASLKRIYAEHRKTQIPPKPTLNRAKTRFMNIRRLRAAIRRWSRRRSHVNWQALQIAAARL